MTKVKEYIMALEDWSSWVQSPFWGNQQIFALNELIK